MTTKNAAPDFPSSPDHAFARRVAVYGCLLPLFNAAAAAAMGVLVVYSDADDHKVLAGFLSACNVGGWVWWLTGSFRAMRWALRRWMNAQHEHPGFRLAGLLSAGGAISWVGVLSLLAYGMLG